MAWGKAGSTDVTSGDALTVSSISNNKSNMILYNAIPSGEMTEYMTMGNGSKDTGSNYANRKSTNGGAEGVYSSRSNIIFSAKSGGTQPELGVGYILNIATEEKLLIHHGVNASSSGAGTTPDRIEVVGKWANTSDVMDVISCDNTGTGDYSTGSNLSVLGSDLTPAGTVPAVPAQDNVQDNSIFVETDTARRYWFDVSKDTTKDGTNSNITLDTTNEKLGTGCYDFNGSTSRSVTSVKFNGLHDGTGGSISFWMRPRNMSSIHGNGDIIFDSMATSAANGTGISILIKNTSLLRVNFTTSSNSWFTDINSTTQFSDNTWYHVVMTFGSNTVKLYINGSQEDTATFSNPNTNASNGNFVIGRHSTDPSSYGYYDGLLDDTGIWNRVLTSSEVTSLYNSGTGALASSISTTDFAGYYNYDAVTGDKLENEIITATWTRGFFNARGVFSSGYLGADINVIDYVTISTLGNATDFGDMSENRRAVAGASNDTRGLFAGGYGASSYVDTIDYITIATAGNATDFGNLTTSARYAPMGASSDTRGLFAGGESPYSNVIDYVTISTTANATDFGDLTAARKSGASTSDKTKAVFMGGEGSTTTMDYVTIATTGNATSWGSMSVGVNGAGTGTISNGTRGVVSLGAVVGNSYSNIIHYKTIATNANSVDFGDLTQGRSGAGQCGDSTRGVFGGGKYQSGGSSGVATIDYITISTLGNATDFGDLTSARYAMAGVSDGQ